MQKCSFYWNLDMALIKVLFIFMVYFNEQFPIHKLLVISNFYSNFGLIQTNI